MRGNKEVRVSCTGIHLLWCVCTAGSARTLLYVTLHMGYLDVVSLVTKNKGQMKLLLLMGSLS